MQKSKIIYLLLTVLFALTVNLLWFRPFFISVFFEKIFWEDALASPEFLSSSGILKKYGLTFYQDNLDDISTEFEVKKIQKAKARLSELKSYNPDSLNAGEKISATVLEWKLKRQIERERFVYYDYPVNQMFGIQNSLPVFMMEVHQIKDKGDADDYIARLKKFKKVFQTLNTEIRERESRGIVLPVFILDKVISEIDRFLVPDASKNILYLDFNKKSENAGLKQKDELTRIVYKILENEIYPSYTKLKVQLIHQRKISDNRAGVWKFPDGEEYYRYLVKYHTTTDLTPEEIHLTGLEEVARIRKEMKEILVKENRWQGNLILSMSMLRQEKRFMYPDSDAGREECLSDYRKIISEMTGRLPEIFDMKIKDKIEVRRIPAIREKNSPSAYYESASLDGSRPGVFYVNLRSMAEIPKFGMRTLAYHEAVPGHHLQQSVQQGMDGVPTFRKFISYTSYVEGWALYAERLAWEYGFQKNPYNNLGRLQAEIFRSVRLVVDTGIHSKKWSREYALRYMKDNTGMADKEVEAEIDRYIIMPGQALAYKTGMIAIIQLRENYKKLYPVDFNIRTFHGFILDYGPVPLEYLQFLLSNSFLKNSKNLSGFKETAKE